mmetsp:Transcript_3851/g.6752  ORF Transcript_3851/g.6752 Transcript_3851/m.6752 type:complete len:140 (+) Transcript_3851:71-490(+)
MSQGSSSVEFFSDEDVINGEITVEANPACISWPPAVADKWLKISEYVIDPRQSAKSFPFAWSASNCGLRSPSNIEETAPEHLVNQPAEMQKFARLHRRQKLSKRRLLHPTPQKARSMPVSEEFRDERLRRRYESLSTAA